MAQDPTYWAGRAAADHSGNRIGTVEDVYLDRRTGEPEFALVSNGLRPGEGSQQTIVPLVGARADGDTLLFGFGRDRIAGAPLFGGEDELTPDMEDEIYAHFGATRPDLEAKTEPLPGAATPAPPPPPPPPTPEPPPAEERSMTRLEEQVEVDKTTAPRERVRVRKHVVTEEVQITVTLRREELRIEREPVIDPSGVDISEGGDIGEAEFDFFLLAERPVVSTEVVPVERVKVTKDVVIDEELVAGQVRKERIDVDREPGA
jgi:uncharacterized protein (TIGR02271 family)